LPPTTAATGDGFSRHCSGITTCSAQKQGRKHQSFKVLVRHRSSAHVLLLQSNFQSRALPSGWCERWQRRTQRNACALFALWWQVVSHL
jgi:hypothetical protein